MTIKCFFGWHTYKAIFAVDSSEVVKVQQANNGAVIPCFMIMACRKCGKAYVDGRLAMGNDQ